ncbi:hypothetical protein HTG_04540 [Natrinema mahii]|nr:hypothetical protein HTG_04540 [Natrinema mahii]
MSTFIPRSVRMESQSADPSTTFQPGQKKAVWMAVRFCRLVDPTLADYSRLLEKIEGEMVLSKKDRRRFQDVLNANSRQHLDSNERRLNAWARSDLWDAHRPVGEER